MKKVLYILLLTVFWSCQDSVPKRTEMGDDGLVKIEMGTSKYSHKYEEASEFISTGQLEQAEKIYIELMKVDTENLESIHVGLGTVNNRREKYAEAEDHYFKAIDINNRSYEGYLGLGSTYYRQRNYNKALANYMIAKTISPERPDAYWGLSITYDHLDYPKYSKYYANKFYELAPNSKYKQLDYFPDIDSDSLTLMKTIWSPDKKFKLEVYKERMFFGMPGQGSDHMATVVLKDAEGEVLDYVDGNSDPDDRIMYSGVKIRWDLDRGRVWYGRARLFELE